MDTSRSTAYFRRTKLSICAVRSRKRQDGSRAFTGATNSSISTPIFGQSTRKFAVTSLNPRMAEFARRLSRSSRIRIWSDQLLVKMPGGRPSYWHQDVPLWAMIESGALSCWMALVDVTASMGCMQFIPGSHRWGRFAWKTLPGDLLETLDGLRLLLPEDKHSRLQPVEVPLKAGSCTFHDGLMMHYAGPNLTAGLGWV